MPCTTYQNGPEVFFHFLGGGEEEDPPPSSIPPPPFLGGVGEKLSRCKTNIFRKRDEKGKGGRGAWEMGVERGFSNSIATSFLPSSVGPWALVFQREEGGI